MVLLFAAAGGYLLAGRALRPVATITDLAARIGAGDLRSRLNLDLPDDELGRLARTFDAMLARIDDAFERQRRFTDDAAHELRTPLSMMRSQVDLTLARPRSTGAYREALQAVDGDIARMTALVGTLLTLARSDAGQLAAERAPFDLADTVRLVLEQYAPVAEEAGVALRDETAPAPLVADEDLLMQLLVNLIDNALAHTPPGARWSLAAGRTMAGSTSGSAIPARGSPRSTRTGSSTASTGSTPAAAATGEGQGWGLAICKAIAEAHGGTIGLTSRLGSGTRVEIVLPDGQPHT